MYISDLIEPNSLTFCRVPSSRFSIPARSFSISERIIFHSASSFSLSILETSSHSFINDNVGDVVLGIKVTVLGFEDTKVLGFEDTKVLGFEVTILGFDNAKVLGFEVTVLGFEDAQVFGFEDTKVFDFEDVQVFGFEDIKGFGFKITVAVGFESVVMIGFEDVCVSDSSFKRFCLRFSKLSARLPPKTRLIILYYEG
jgi:hypothetical protein